MDRRSNALRDIEKEIRPGISDPQAVAIIERLATLLAAGEVDAKRACNDIYWTAWHAGAWSDAHKDDEAQIWVDLAEWGAEFVQLADALDTYKHDKASIQLLSELIEQGALALLRRDPLPNWKGGRGGVFRVES